MDYIIVSAVILSGLAVILDFLQGRKIFDFDLRISQKKIFLEILTIFCYFAP